MAINKRQLTRTKSTRPAIVLSGDYEERAVTILKTSYASYDDAKKAVDAWQELAGQTMHIKKQQYKELHPGTRATRKSQTEKATLICKSATGCPYKCRIRLQDTGQYRVFLKNKTHTCLPGAIPQSKQESESPVIKIPQKLRRHLTSHHSPTTAKRNKSINIWRRAVSSSSSDAGLVSDGTSFPESPKFHQDLEAEQLPYEKPKSAAASGIREAMQARPPVQQNQASMEEVTSAIAVPRFSEPSESKGKQPRPRRPEDIQKKKVHPPKPLAALPHPVPATKTKTSRIPALKAPSVYESSDETLDLPAYDLDNDFSINLSTAYTQDLSAIPSAPRKKQSHQIPIPPKHTSSQPPALKPIVEVRRQIRHSLAQPPGPKRAQFSDAERGQARANAAAEIQGDIQKPARMLRNSLGPAPVQPGASHSKGEVKSATSHQTTSSSSTSSESNTILHPEEDLPDDDLLSPSHSLSHLYSAKLKARSRSAVSQPAPDRTSDIFQSNDMPQCEGIAIYREASLIRGLGGLYSPIHETDFDVFSELPEVYTDQLPATPKAPRKKNRCSRVVSPVYQLSSSAAPPSTPAPQIKKQARVPQVATHAAQPTLEAVPAVIEIPQADNGKARSIPAVQSPRKRVASVHHTSGAEQVEILGSAIPAAKRQRMAAAEDIHLADARHKLDRKLVSFLALAGCCYLSDIIDLGMLEDDMGAVLSAIYAEMQGFYSSPARIDAEEYIRDAVRRCAETVTIGKFRGLYRLGSGAGSSLSS